MMNTEYTTSTGYKIFYSVLGLLAVGFALFLFKVPSHADSKLIFLLPLFILVLGIMIIVNQLKRKLTISDTGITYANIFKSTTIPFDEVKGYRIGSKVIYVESDQDGRKITMNDYLSLGDSDSLKDWLRGNFKDLDKEDYESEKDAILHDASLGATEQDREQKLRNAKIAAIGYSMGGILLVFVVVIVHRVSYAMSYLLMAYPLVGLVLMALSQGLIRLVTKKSSAYKPALIGILAPSFMLIVQVISKTEMVSYDKLWVPALAVAFVMFIALYFTGIRRSPQAVAASLIVAVVVSALYGFGTILQINCVFDESSPEIYKTIVVDEYISHGKSTSYNLKLGAWGPVRKSVNVTVSRSFYHQTPVGASVQVYLKKGTLNIPWYYVNQ